MRATLLKTWRTWGTSLADHAAIIHGNRKRIPSILHRPLQRLIGPKGSDRLPFRAHLAHSKIKYISKEKKIRHGFSSRMHWGSVPVKQVEQRPKPRTFAAQAYSPATTWPVPGQVANRSIVLCHANIRVLRDKLVLSQNPYETGVLG